MSRLWFDIRCWPPSWIFGHVTRKDDLMSPDVTLHETQDGGRWKSANNHTSHQKKSLGTDKTPIYVWKTFEYRQICTDFQNMWHRHNGASVPIFDQNTCAEHSGTMCSLPGQSGEQPKPCMRYINTYNSLWQNSSITIFTNLPCNAEDKGCFHYLPSGFVVRILDRDWAQKAN